ncbi:MAG: hypothetical protein HC796_09530 [Synechococcaceae cyanobacterium RL_1_2]|nr:hypothetical protein [Synechococcaceae cyanobacterium RL_1_2]
MHHWQTVIKAGLIVSCAWLGTGCSPDQESNAQAPSQQQQPKIPIVEVRSRRLIPRAIGRAIPAQRPLAARLV